MLGDLDCPVHSPWQKQRTKVTSTGQLPIDHECELMAASLREHIQVFRYQLSEEMPQARRRHVHHCNLP